jgi:predicted DNA-binding protein
MESKSYPKCISLRLSQRQKENIELHSKMTGLPQANIIRLAIFKYFQNEDSRTD